MKIIKGVILKEKKGMCWKCKAAFRFNAKDLLRDNRTLVCTECGALNARDEAEKFYDEFAMNCDEAEKTAEGNGT